MNQPTPKTALRTTPTLGILQQRLQLLQRVLQSAAPQTHQALVATLMVAALSDQLAQAADRQQANSGDDGSSPAPSSVQLSLFTPDAVSDQPELTAWLAQQEAAALGSWQQLIQSALDGTHPLFSAVAVETPEPGVYQLALRDSGGENTLVGPVLSDTEAMQVDTPVAARALQDGHAWQDSTQETPTLLAQLDRAQVGGQPDGTATDASTADASGGQKSTAKSDEKSDTSSDSKAEDSGTGTTDQTATSEKTAEQEGESSTTSKALKGSPASLLAGGGGGGGGGSGALSAGSAGASMAAGSVIKGYLDQAVVWRDGNGDGVFNYDDANHNGLFDIGEKAGNGDVYVVTDAQGNYSGLGGSGALHVFGGTDLYGTGLVFRGVLLAPETSQVVTSLTTLVQSIRTGSNLSVDASVSAVKQLLNLDSNVTAADLLNLDPVETAYASSTTTDKVKYLKLYATSAQVANIMVVGAAAVQKAATTTLSTTQASQRVLDALAKSYADLKSSQGSSVQAVDLTQASFIGTVMKNVAGVTISNADDIASAVANVNAAVKEVFKAADPNSKAALNSMVATEFASQDTLTNAIAKGTFTATNFTADKIASLLSEIALTVGSLSAPDNGGRSVPAKPVLVEISQSVALTLLGGEQLKSGQTYRLKQDLNSDVVAGDVLRVYVNGVDTRVSHTVTAAEVAAKKLEVHLDASIWSIASGTGVNGVDYKLSTRFYTASGIAGAESRDYTVKLDNVANTPTVAWTVDTEVADNISSDAKGVRVVGAEIGATLDISVNGNGQTSLQKVTGSPLDLAASSFGISADGNYSISVRQTDAAGNTSGWSTPITLTYDTQAPQVTQAPVAGSFSIAKSMSSAVSWAFKANEALKGAEVEVWTADAKTSAALTFDPVTQQVRGDLSSLAAGNYVLKFKPIDVAGNKGSVSDYAFAIKSPAFVTTSHPEYISLADVTQGLVLTGTAEGVAPQTPVTATLTDAGGQTFTQSGVVDSSGQFSLTLTASSLASLAEGAYSLAYAMTPAEGKVSTPVYSTVLDKTPPTVSVALQDSLGQPVEVITQSMIDEGLTVSGATVGVPEGHPVSVAVKDSLGATAVVLSGVVHNHHYSIAVDYAQAVLITTGELSLQATVLDAAGNSGSGAQSLSANLGPAQAKLAALSDNQLSATELALPFEQKVTLTDPKAQIVVTLFNTSTQATVTDVLSFSTAQRAIQGNLGTLADGEYRIQVQVFASNDTSKSDVLQTINQRLVVDKTAPTGFTVSPLSPTVNQSTVDAGLTFTGSVTGVESGQSVDIFNGTSKLGSTVVGQDGTFSVSLSAATVQALGGDGTYALQARVQDQAGNAAPAVAITLKLDVTPPSTPTSLSLVTDTGVSSSDKVTSSSAGLTITAKALASDANALAQLLDGGEIIEGAVATVGASGAIEFTNIHLVSGVHNLSVVLQDAALNQGARSADMTVLIDDAAPVVAAVQVPGAGVYDRGQVMTFVVESSEVLYLDTTGGSPKLNLALDSPTPRYATYVSGSGSNKLVFEYQVSAGDLDVNGIELKASTVGGVSTVSMNLAGARVTDAAGNNLNLVLNQVGNLDGVKVNGAVVGSAVDGYLVNATIFSDANHNNQVDAGEAVGGTIGPGVFSLPGGAGHLIMRGGEDISTGLDFSVQYEAPEGYLVINPVSTLIAAIQSLEGATYYKYDSNGNIVSAAQTDAGALVQYKLSTADAEQKALSAGLFGSAGAPANLNLASYDAFREAGKSVGAYAADAGSAVQAAKVGKLAAVAYQKNAAMLATLADVGGSVIAALDDTLSNNTVTVAGKLSTDASVAVIDAVAAQLKASSSTQLSGLLTNASALTSVLTSAASQLGLGAAADATKMAQVANVIATANGLIANASTTSIDGQGNDAKDAIAVLRGIVAVQQVVQGESADVLTRYVMGNSGSDPSPAALASGLATKAASVIVGPIVPSIFKVGFVNSSGVQSDAATVFEGTASGDGQSLVFKITRAGGLDGTVVLNYGVSGSTALTGARFEGGSIPSGSITFAPDVTEQTVTIKLVNNSVRDAAERLTLQLSDAYGNSQFTNLQGQLVSQARVGVTVLDDDPNTPIISAPTSGALASGVSTKVAGLSVDYFDASAPLNVTIKAVNGTVQLEKLPLASINVLTAGSDGTYTLSGTLGDINSALSRVMFTGKVATADGAADQVNGSIRIQVTPADRATVVGSADTALTIHHAPQITLPGATSVTAGTLSKLPSLSVLDVDSAYLTVSLTSLQGKVVPGVASAGVFISQKSDGSLSIAGSVLDVKAALADLSFLSMPGTTQAVVQLSVSDGDPLTRPVTTSWNLTVNKAAPVLLSPSSLNFKAGVASALSAVLVADADSSKLTVTIDASKGKLSWSDLPSDVSVVTSTSGQIVLKGQIASLNSALKGVFYTAPTTGAPTLTFTLSDGETTAVKQTVSVAVLDNAPPAAGGDVTIQGVVEDAAKTFTLTPTLADADAGTDASGVPSSIRILSVTGGTLTLADGTAIVLGESATPLALSGTGIGLKFTPDANRTETASIRYVMVDKALSSLNSTPSVLTIPITSVNDKPVVVVSNANVNFVEKGAPVVLLPQLGLSDIDSKMLSGAVLSINNATSADLLTYVQTSGNPVTGSVSSNQGVLTLTLSGNASVDQYRAALQSVKFSNPSVDLVSATRNLTLTITDVKESSTGTAQSSDAVNFSLSVTGVNDAPVVVMSSLPLSFTESTSADKKSVSTALTGLQLADPDGVAGNLSGAEVKFVAGYRPGEDSLSVGTPGSLQTSFDAATGVLTLKGSASQTVYQTALASVIYQNSSANPGTQARDLKIGLLDAQGAVSLSTAIRLNVTATDDQARLDLSGTDFDSLNATALFAGGLGSAPVLIASQANLRDPDNSTFKSITLSLVSPTGGDTSFSGPATGDELGLNAGASAAALASGLTVGFNANRTTLTLSASSSIDLTTIESVLRGVTFNHVKQVNETLSGARKVVVSGVDANSKSIVPTEVVVSLANGPFAAVTSSVVNGVTQYTLALDGTPGSSKVLVDLSASVVATATGRLSVKDIFLAQNIDATALNVAGVGSISLVGNGNANTLVGSSGADVIQGGGGADVIRAGAGDDTIVSSIANVMQAASIDGGSGTDTLLLMGDGGSIGAGGSDVFGKISQIEQLQLAGTSTMTVKLPAGSALTSIGGAGMQGAGIVVDASASTQAMTLTGSAQDDTLQGGSGQDRLAGGGGADTFVFRANSSSTSSAAYDTIVDLAVGDKIRIDVAGLQWATTTTRLDSTKLYAWLDTTNSAAPVLFYQTTPGATPMGISINASVRLTGWEGVSSSTGLTITLPVNTPPVLQVPTTSAQVPLLTQGVNMKTPLMGLNVLDADSDFQTVTLQVVGGTLAVDGGGISSASSTGVLVLSGTTPNINLALKSLVFTASARSTSTSLASVTAVVHDQVNLTDSAPQTVYLKVPNTPPVFTMSGNGSPNLVVGVAQTVTGASVSDVDGGVLSLSFSTSSGTGEFGAASGVTWGGVQATGAGTGTVVLRGTADQLNALLAQNKLYFKASAMADDVVTVSLLDDMGAKAPDQVFKLSPLPGAPAAPDLLDTSDSGGSSTDNITNIKTPEFSVGLTGTGAVAGAVVQLFSNTTLIASKTLTSSEVAAQVVTVAVPSGVITADGTQSFTAKLAYQSKVSSASNALAVTFATFASQVYEGATTSGAFPNDGSLVYLRDTAGDNAVDVNMTQGLRVIGQDASGRTYILNWKNDATSTASTATPQGHMMVHRVLSSGALDMTYEVRLPTDTGALSFLSNGTGTDSFKIRGVSDVGAIYVEHTAVSTGTTTTSATTTHTLERYLSSSTGIQVGTQATSSAVVKDPNYNVTLSTNASVLSGTTDGKVYARTFVTTDTTVSGVTTSVTQAEIVRYNSDGTLDTTWMPNSNSHKLVVDASYGVGIGRGVVGVDDRVYVKSWDPNLQSVTVTRYSNGGALDTGYAIKLPVGVTLSNIRGQDASGNQYVQRTLSDGKMVLERYVATVTTTGTAATQSTSQLDTAFGTNGQLILPASAVVISYPKFNQLLVYSGTTTAAELPDAVYSMSTGATLAVNDGWNLSADGHYVLDATVPQYNALAAGESGVATLTYKTIDLNSSTGQVVSGQTFSLKVVGTNDWPVAQDAAITLSVGNAASVQVSATDVDAGATLTYTAGARVEAFAPVFQSLGLKPVSSPYGAWITSGQMLTADGKSFGYLNSDDQGRLYVWTQAQPVSGSTTIPPVEIVRYNKAGGLDSTYKITLPTDIGGYLFGTQPSVRGVANDGSVYVEKVLTNSTSATSTTSSSITGYELLRYKPGGSLDTAFGVQGHLALSSSVSQVMGNPTTTGALYVREYVGNVEEIHRYTAAGVLDTSFKLVLPTSASYIQVRRGVYGDDSLYLVQDSYVNTTSSASTLANTGLFIQRYTAAGVLDEQFNVTIPNTNLGELRAVSGLGVMLEKTVYDSTGTHQALQLFNTNGTLNVNYGTAGTLIIPTGSQYVLTNGALEMVDAQGKLTVYGPEGHVASSTAVPGLMFDAASRTFSIDTSNAAYSNLMAGQSKVISAHYTVTDQSGAWDEGEVKITVSGDRVYEGTSASGSLVNTGTQVFIRDTAGDDAVDVNMTDGLRVVGKDSSGRVYILNWDPTSYANSSSNYVPVGRMQIHRVSSAGVLDTAYEVNLPSDSGALSFVSDGIGTYNYKLRGISDSGAVYVQHNGTTTVGTTTTSTVTLERYLSSVDGLQGDPASSVNKDATFNVALGSNATVVFGASDGKVYVRTWATVSTTTNNTTTTSNVIEITRYNSNGGLDTTWLPNTTTHKLVLNDLNNWGVSRGVASTDDFLYIRTVDATNSFASITRYTNAGELDITYAIKLPFNPASSNFRGQDANGRQYIQRALNNGTYVLERYLPTVTAAGVTATQSTSLLDTTFGTNGQIVLPGNATILTFPKLDQILVYASTTTGTEVPDQIYAMSTGASLVVDDGWSLSPEGYYTLDATVSAYNSLAKDALANATLSYKIFDTGSGSSGVASSGALTLKVVGTNDWPLAQDATASVTSGATASVQVHASDVDTGATLTYTAGARIESFAAIELSLGLLPVSNNSNGAWITSNQMRSSDGSNFGYMNSDDQGRLYVWKQAMPAAGVTTYPGAEIVRYSKSGVLDTTYKLTLPNDISGLTLRGVTNDGSVYVYKATGITTTSIDVSTTSTTTTSSEIVRYKPDGTIDTAYGVQGSLKLATGSIQVLGVPTTTGALYVREPGSTGVDEIHRYTAAGVLDTTFKVTLPTSYSSSMPIQLRRGFYGDDGVYLAMDSYPTTNYTSGSASYGLLIQRYSSSGALDAQYNVMIPGVTLSQLRGVSGGGVLIEKSLMVNSITSQVLQLYTKTGTLSTSYGTDGSLTIPTGSQYALTAGGLEMVDAAGAVTLYGPEGHKVSATAIPGLTFNASTQTFSLDTSNAVYSTLMVGQTKAVYTHYTVVDSYGAWDEGEVKFVVNGSSASPLALDLNGDHRVTTNLAAQYPFQILPGTPTVLKGWVSAVDALLVRDLNGNHRIDNGAELFGVGTRVPSGETAQDGFQALQMLDSNGDGRIDVTDSAFSELGLWQDANGNGITDAGELTTLADHHITALRLNPQTGSTVENGHLQGLISSYETDDGLSHDLIDVFFQAVAGADALVAAAAQLSSTSHTGADLVCALSEAGFVAARASAASALSVHDELAAVLVQAGLLSADRNAEVNIQTQAQDPQLHLTLKQLADLGVDHVTLSGHATVDLGIQSLSRDELSQLLSTLQGQRADTAQPLLGGQGATLVMSNVLMTDLLQGQTDGDPVVQAILKSLQSLGVNQLDGVEAAQVAPSGSLMAVQSVGLVTSALSSAVDVQILGPDPQDLSQLLDHDLLSKPLS